MTNDELEAEVDRINALIARLRPVLLGQGATAQGAALADCLARWLAGHTVPGDPDATRAMREMMLKSHLITVRELTAVHAKRLGTEVPQQ